VQKQVCIVSCFWVLLLPIKAILIPKPWKHTRDLYFLVKRQAKNSSKMRTNSFPEGRRLVLLVIQRLSFGFFSPVAYNLNRETERQGKSNALPNALVPDKSYDHHDKAKNANRYCKGVSFSEILFHGFRLLTWNLHEAWLDSNVVLSAKRFCWLSAKPEKASANKPKVFPG
jgi:hypothetical protein